MHMFKTVVFLALVCGIVAANYDDSKKETSGKELKLVELNENNFVAIRGVIDEHSASRFISDVMKLKNNKIYVYLITPGGSVISGMSIIQTISTLQASGKEFICIADRAASMGFVIFQACAKRYIMEHSIVMQHQVSLGIEGPFEQVKNYIKLIETIDKRLNHNQATKVGMTAEKFHENVQHDWWLYGQDIITNGAADEMVNVICDFDTTKVYEIKKYTFFGEIDLQFSLCPLIHNPSNVKINMNHNKVIEQVNNEYTNFKKNTFQTF